MMKEHDEILDKVSGQAVAGPDWKGVKECVCRYLGTGLQEEKTGGARVLRQEWA